MLHQEIHLENPSIAFAFRIFPSERTEQQGSPWRHGPTVAFLGQCSTRFSTGNCRQLSMEAESAWAGNEPVFPCVHAFLKLFPCFLFALVIPMGSSVRGAGPQHGKPGLPQKIRFLRDIWSISSGAAEDTWHPYSQSVLSSPGGATTVILSYLPHSLWQTFGKQRHWAANAIPESQDYCWLALYRGCA